MSEEAETPVGQREFFHYKNITFQRVPNGSEMSGTGTYKGKGGRPALGFL